MAVLELEPVETPIPTCPAYPVLLVMAELISRRGWCQGKYEDSDGRLCIQGAYSKLLEQDDRWLGDPEWELPYRMALAAFEKSIAPEMGERDEWWDSADWNDVPGRTKLEVIDRLRRVGMLGK